MSRIPRGIDLIGRDMIVTLREVVVLSSPEVSFSPKLTMLDSHCAVGGQSPPFSLLSSKSGEEAVVYRVPDEPILP